MSGVKKPRVLYWDACVYLAWIKAEDNGQAVNDAISETVDLNAKGEVILVTSTLSITEVLSAELTDDQRERFEKCFGPNHLARDVDGAIARKARDFRRACHHYLKSKKVLSTPDAIQLATALISDAEECWTFDRGRSDKRCLGLIQLNKTKNVEGLAICVPYLNQANLPLAPAGKKKPASTP